MITFLQKVTIHLQLAIIVPKMNLYSCCFSCVKQNKTTPVNEVKWRQRASTISKISKLPSHKRIASSQLFDPVVYHHYGIFSSLLDITNSPALTSLGLVITNSLETTIMSYSSLLDNITNLPICQFGSHDSSSFLLMHAPSHFHAFPYIASMSQHQKKKT